MRNANSHFAKNPYVDIGRSKFSRNSSVKTTFNVGNVIPFYVDEVLPGDTFQIKTNKVVRMQSLLTPVMDNIYLDTYYFYVPNRLVWQHWKEFNGENNESAWVSPVEYSVPQITAPAGGWNIGTIADYMGLPTGVENISVSALPFRAYALIMNEWFRDENLTDPLLIPTDDSNQTGTNGTGNYINDVANGGLPFVAAKYHDYFTSCLPAPQKGADVTVSAFGDVPVKTSQYFLQPSDLGTYPLVFMNSSNGSTWDIQDSTSSSGSVISGAFLRGNYNQLENAGTYLEPTGVILNNSSDTSSLTSALAAGDFSNNLFSFSDSNVRPVNLVADLSSATIATINQLRFAFQIQKLLEKDARGGTRYTEILRSHFGVSSPDSRLQRPEYLGGNRLPININQVVQTSSTTADSPQGTTAAFSQTVDSHGDFIRSFVEHGFVIGVMVARYDHSYQQGIERFWSRQTRFDYYWPVLANIGEQAVLNKEIYAQGTAEDDEVFGYQEAWADYRYKPNRVTGEMRSQYAQSLDVWHLADDYSQLPALSDEWIREDPSVVDRVLAVSSNVSAQLFADIYVQNTTTRPMPMYSIPGLIDHH